MVSKFTKDLALLGFCYHISPHSIVRLILNFKVSLMNLVFKYKEFASDVLGLN